MSWPDDSTRGVAALYVDPRGRRTPPAFAEFLVELASRANVCPF